MSYFSENEIAAAMTVKLDDVLPEKTVFQEGIRRAPDRGFRLTQDLWLPLASKRTHLR